ncbi:transcription termination factor MTERF5 [Cucumis melo var. makuwa]|uniref:Transcription termination factor MTERF5 n=1 Tax=Cucumis melo var. makuwa TaxID=1194695 RepID=A0A5A7TBZ9_CUCMM|nr:transcription termination factor MTERF5 [Cucumis melo var. makuwa]
MATRWIHLFGCSLRGAQNPSFNFFILTPKCSKFPPLFFYISSRNGSPTSAGRKLQFVENNIQQYGAIIGFLKSHGFENPQIVNLVSMYPSILQSGVSTNLKPKFEFLQEIGFVGPLLPKLIVSSPRILHRSLDSQLKPSFFFCKEILESDEQVTAAIRHSPWLLTSDFKGILKSNIDVLASGVPSRKIVKLIVMNSRTIMQTVDRMIEVVKTVKELGIEPKAGMFVYALRVRSSMSDSSWKKKINVMKSLGWSENEIFSAFKKYPLFSLFRGENEGYCRFLFQHCKVGSRICNFLPCVLQVVNRQARYKILEILKVKNLVKNKKIAAAFMEWERRFVERYVVKHLDEIPNLMDIYRGNVAAETKFDLRLENCRRFRAFSNSHLLDIMYIHLLHFR